MAAKKDNIKTQRSLMDELAGLHGQALADEAQKQGQPRCCCDAMPNLLCFAMLCRAYIALTVLYTVLEC